MARTQRRPLSLGLLFLGLLFIVPGIALTGASIYDGISSGSMFGMNHGSSMGGGSDDHHKNMGAHMSDPDHMSDHQGMNGDDDHMMSPEDCNETQMNHDGYMMDPQDCEGQQMTYEDCYEEAAQDNN